MIFFFLNWALFKVEESAVTVFYAFCSFRFACADRCPFYNCRLHCDITDNGVDSCNNNNDNTMDRGFTIVILLTATFSKPNQSFHEASMHISGIFKIVAGIIIAYRSISNHKKRTTRFYRSHN